MLEIFKPPVLEGNEPLNKAYVFHKLLVGTIIITSLEFIIFWIVSPGNILRWVISISAIEIPSLCLLYLNKKGYNKTASNLFILVTFIIITLISWTSGGVKAPILYIIPILILFVGLLKGWKQGLIAGLYLALMGLGMALAEIWHILPVSEVQYTDFNLWLVFFTSIALLALLQFNAIENLNKALAKIQQELSLRAKVEKELRSSEEFRKRVFESSLTPIIVMDGETYHFIDCNPAAISIYGFGSKDETLGKTPLDVSATNQYDGQLSSVKAKQYIDEAIEKGQIHFDWLHQRPNGEFWDAEVHLISFEVEDRKFLQFTLIDITQRLKTIKTLDETETRLKSISNHFNDGMIYQVVISKDDSRKFTYLSDSVKSLYGISPEEAMADSGLIYGKIHPDDIQSLILAEIEAIKNLSVFKTEARVINPNGDIRWSSFVSTPKLNEDGSLCFDGIEFIISDQKLAEEAHRISAAQLKANLDNTPNVAIQWYDQDGKVLFWNPASEVLYGWSAAEAMGKTLDQLIYTPEEAAAFKKIIDDIAQTGQSFGPFESSVKRRNGSTGWIIATIFSFPIDQHQIGFACMDVDITERKFAEESLQESEERFKTLSSIASEGLMIHENGIIVDMNQVFANLQGHQSINELIGKEAIEAIRFTPESKKLVYEHFIRNSDETFDIEIIDRDGKLIQAETRGSQIIYKGRKANLVYMRDISDRKKAERELKESEERYRKLIEAFPDIIMVADLKGDILYANEPFEKLTGISPVNYTNRNHQAQIHPEDKKLVIDALQDLLSSDKNHTEIIENRFIDIWGNIHWLSGIIVKTTFEGKVVIQTVSREITEKKLIEKELEKYRNHLEVLVKERTDELAATNEELNTLNEELYEQREELQASLNKLNETQKRLIQSEKMASLGILSAGIAHEINNPLNFIHGGITIIEQYSKSNLQDHLQELNPFIEAIQVGVKRASDIVTSLSHYSRKDEFPINECNIHSIIDNCLIMLQNQLKNKVEIEKHYTDKHYIFIGSEGKMHQAILNIISNAEQAIDSKGNIKIKTDIVGNNLLITIKDNGNGISTENLNKIFDPFFTTKNPGKGTGLGLSITFNIIHDHHGTIEYTSNPGDGTTVTIKLPINKKNRI